MLCGYLSPEGDYFECGSYGHMDLAKELAETLFNEPYLSGIKAEDLLFDNHFLCFTSRGASFRFAPYEGGHLSDKQVVFIEEHWSDISNDEQREELEEILKWDKDIREASILSRVEEKYLLK